MDEDRENDRLWDLLGSAPPAQASPYFVRRVLREVRTNRRPAPAWGVLLRWLAPLGAAATVLVASSIWLAPAPDEGDFNALFDSAADLQSLVAYDDMGWAETN
jgi:hypothetical protein